MSLQQRIVAFFYLIVLVTIVFWWGHELGNNDANDDSSPRRTWQSLLDSNSRLLAVSSSSSSLTESGNVLEYSSAASCTWNASSGWMNAPSLLPGRWRGDPLQIPTYASIYEFTEPALSESDDRNASEVRCDFLGIERGRHFAHAMQQLYACITLFRHHHFQSPVLLYPPSDQDTFLRNDGDHNAVVMPEFFGETDFLKEFIRLMQTKLGVTLRPAPHSDASAAARAGAFRVRRGINHIPPDGFHISREAAEFIADRLELMNHQHPASSSSSCRCRNADSSSSSWLEPRIAILNRRGPDNRAMINAEETAQALHDALSLTSEPPVVYFENATFRDQAEFFANTDLVISPHGAQLTGLALMRRPCAAVMEFFPPGYCIPYYFGSLAVGSDIQYSYLSLGQEPCFLSNKNRRELRNVDMCPPIQAILEAAKSMVDQWRKCCCHS